MDLATIFCISSLEKELVCSWRPVSHDVNLGPVEGVEYKKMSNETEESWVLVIGEKEKDG